MQMAGKYELIGVIAQHAHGRVWQGRDPDLDRPVAAKQVDLADVVAVERLRSEAQVLASLDDPHIVSVYDVVEADGKVWLIEEWIDGAALDAVLAQARRLSPEQAVGVVRGALLGLAAAHQRGVVHGDVSPGNILLDQAGVSKLVDFGLAGASGLPGVSGTPGYLSPEVATGRPVTARSDVYSAAVVLASLLQGRPLFPVTTTVETVGRQLAEAPDLVGVRGQLREVLATALQHDPASRYADAAEFLAALEPASEEDLGAAWLGQAGVAGLVTATVTAVAVRATSASAESPGAVSSTESIAATPVVVRQGRRSLHAKPAALVGGGAVVAIVAVVAVLLAGQHSSSHATAAVLPAATTTAAPAVTPSAAASTTVAPAPTIAVPTSAAPTTTVAPPKPLTPGNAFTGRYHLDATFTATKGKWVDTVVGASDKVVTWTVTATCHATCTALARSSSGRIWHLTYTGGAWKTSLAETGTCYDADGKPSTTAHGSALLVSITLHPGAAAVGKKPKVFTMAEKGEITVDNPGCTGYKGDYYTEAGAAKRY